MFKQDFFFYPQKTYGSLSTGWKHTRTPGFGGDFCFDLPSFAFLPYLPWTHFKTSSYSIFSLKLTNNNNKNPWTLFPCGYNILSSSLKACLYSIPPASNLEHTGQSSPIGLCLHHSVITAFPNIPSHLHFSKANGHF